MLYVHTNIAADDHLPENKARSAFLYLSFAFLKVALAGQ